MANPSTGYFKQINLLPSEWQLDVWVCDNPHNIADAFSERYGASKEHYLEEFYPNQVTRIDSTDESILAGRTQVVMQLASFDKCVLVHELTHVLWHYAAACGLEMNYESQEWQAVLFEFLFKQCTDKKSFTKFKKES